MRNNLIKFSQMNLNLKRVESLRKAINGFGFKVMDGSNSQEFNVIVGKNQNTKFTEPNVVNVTLTEQGWFFKTDLASIDYDINHNNVFINRMKAKELIEKAMDDIRKEIPKITLNQTEYNGILQLRDVGCLKNFTVVFMLGISLKAKTNPIAVIIELAQLPRAKFEIE